MAEAILLGPFAGGLNNASDQSAIQDTDLYVVENFDMELDRSLISRPPIVDLSRFIPTGSLRLLGIYYKNGAPYLIGSDGITSTYYYSGAAWVLITNTVSASCFIQFKDKAWLVADPSTTQVGGSWEPAGGFSAVAAMPRGGCIAVSKERLWIGGGKEAGADAARITYCGPSAPTSWPASSPAGGGFFEVQGGDGQAIVEIINYYNDLAVFKEHSTYRFSYSNSPDGGQVTPLDSTIGCLDEGCVVKYRSSIYVLYGEQLYELTNASFVPINMKVPFDAPPVFGLKRPFNLSAWDGRVFVQYQNKCFVYTIETQTWATWVSSVVGPIGRVMGVASADSDEATAFIESAATDSKSQKLFRISRIPGLESETIVCQIRSKIYDYQMSHAWKRLMFWGADVSAPGTVEANVVPVTYSLGTPWNQMTRPWNSPLNAGWALGLNIPINVTDSAVIESSQSPRKFIKWLKSLRFRQVYFELKMVTDGSALSGPAKLFTITTWVSAKQLTSKKIN